jgi:hypothetical protein
MRRRNAELIGQAQRIEISPPRRGVLYENMHHHVFSPGLDVVALQQEGVFPEAHFRKSLSEPIGFESDSLVETQNLFRIPLREGMDGTREFGQQDQ